jgi:methionine synthase I (cobalamin-dependent)
MSFERIRGRLTAGRPLVVAADISAGLRARGLILDVPGALGQLLRENPDEVLAHHIAEVACRVDVLAALTADTTPRALAEVGMEHRAAQLTGRAVDLAREAAIESPKPVAVAGVLGSDMVSPVAATRLHEELTEHAERLAVAGCELLIARGQGLRLNLMAAVIAASRTELPTWAVVEHAADGGTGEDGRMDLLFEALEGAGATAVLFEVPNVDLGLSELSRCAPLLEGGRLVAGILLAASDHAVPGFPEQGDSEAWADRALDLSIGGARVIGGGAGTTVRHTQALARALGSLHPSFPARNSDTEHGSDPGGW